jgi:hypothetical protein
MTLCSQEMRRKDVSDGPNEDLGDIAGYFGYGAAYD